MVGRLKGKKNLVAQCCALMFPPNDKKQEARHVDEQFTRMYTRTYRNEEENHAAQGEATGVSQVS